MAKEAAVRAIEAVLFDLDGTLYDRDRLVTALVRDQYEAFSSELCEVGREHFVDSVLAMDDHGHGEKGSGYARVVRELDLPAALADRLVEHFWTHYDGYCELTADTRCTLQTLRSSGLKLGIITNGGVERQRCKIDALGLEPWFDVIVISEAEGVRKPDAEIFRRALERCGVEARAAVFVGDHPEADVEGARGAGLTAIWKAVSYWRVAADVPAVTRLSEILPMCGAVPSTRAAT